MARQEDAALALFAENVERWRDDIVAFAQETIQIVRPDTGRLGPLVLEKHEKAWLREATRELADGSVAWGTVVASWPKREGKSLCVAILILWRICCWLNQHCVVLANSERQAASVIYDELVNFFAHSELLRTFASSDDIERKKLRVVLNGNTVECVPCNQRTVQGVAVTGILAVDELHAAPDIEAYNYLAAQTEMRDAQIAISSQAGVPDESNAVWRLYQASQQDGASVFFSYADRHMSPWAVSLAARQKPTLIPAEYRKLHENGWVGLGEKAFEPDDLDAAAQDYGEPRTRADLMALVQTWGFGHLIMDIGMGLDRAGVGTGGDRSVLTTVARFSDPQRVFPAQYRVLRVDVFRTGAEAEILSAFRDLREMTGSSPGIIMEAYGCSDLADKVKGASLEAPTPRRQHQMFTALWRALNERRLAYPELAGRDHRKERDGLLKSELVGFEYGYGTAGLMRYGTQSGHDDTVYSLAWALEAVPDEGTQHVYRADEIAVSAGGGWVANYA